MFSQPVSEDFLNNYPVLFHPANGVLYYYSHFRMILTVLCSFIDNSVFRFFSFGNDDNSSLQEQWILNIYHQFKILIISDSFLFGYHNQNHTLASNTIK
jgi:hypothetical protein